MTPTELYALYRADVVDVVTPYLWTDVEVQSFAADAQDMFCRLTGGLHDASSELTEIGVTAGEKWAPYSDRILRVVGASLRSTGDVLSVLNPADLTNSAKAWGPRSINLPGTVCAIVLGLDDAQLRIVQVPQADDIIDLTIERMSLRQLTPTGRLEIPAQHHIHLLPWMRHLGYGKQDSETFDKALSEKGRADFEAYCARATYEKSRRINKPRLIAYGGL